MYSHEHGIFIYSEIYKDFELTLSLVHKNMVVSMEYHFLGIESQRKGSYQGYSQGDI